VGSPGVRVVFNSTSQREAKRGQSTNKKNRKGEMSRVRIKSKKKPRLELQVKIVEIFCHYSDKSCHYLDNHSDWAFFHFVENDSQAGEIEI
jgi:hypothetical protein